jgi:MFS family permease
VRPPTPPDEPPTNRRGRRPLFGLPRPVWLLGLTSLLTDTASEAIYPLLPVYLTRVLGAGALSLGVIEGMAEAANSVLKVLSGRLSDRWRVRRPIVIAGYGLSSAVRPLTALVTSWPQLLAVRFTDRVGKGIRGAPRDALLAACASPDTRGRIFGFHRAMDHVGATVGPLLASLFLFLLPGRYRALFALTLVPGALAVASLFLLREPHADPESAAAQTNASAPAELAGWRSLPRQYFLLLAVLLVFTLGNSADAFLLLRLTDVGIAPPVIPLLWALLHVVKASFSVWGGVKSDRWGRRALIGAGWAVYALVYAGFAVAASRGALVTLFLAYGVYYGLSEGVEKALVADLAPRQLRATAFGVYNAVLGVGSLLASVVFGLVWKLASPSAAFAMGASVALLATVLLALVLRPGRRDDV